MNTSHHSNHQGYQYNTALSAIGGPLANFNRHNIPLKQNAVGSATVSALAVKQRQQNNPFQSSSAAALTRTKQYHAQQYTGLLKQYQRSQQQKTGSGPRDSKLGSAQASSIHDRSRHKVLEIDDRAMEMKRNAANESRAGSLDMPLQGSRSRFYEMSPKYKVMRISQKNLQLDHDDSSTGRKPQQNSGNEQPQQMSQNQSMKIVQEMENSLSQSSRSPRISMAFPGIKSKADGKKYMNMNFEVPKKHSIVTSMINSGTGGSLRSQVDSIEHDHNQILDGVIQQKRHSRKTGLITPIDELKNPQTLLKTGRNNAQIKIYQSNTDLLNEGLVLNKNNNPPVEEFTHSTSYEDIETFNTKSTGFMGKPQFNHSNGDKVFHITANVEQKRKSIFDSKEFQEGIREYYLQSQQFQIFFIKFWKLFLKLQYDFGKMQSAQPAAINVTQVPLNRDVYFKVFDQLKVILEGKYQDQVQSGGDKNQQKMQSKKGQKLIYFSEFCTDFIKVFSTEQLERFTPNQFVDLMRNLFKFVTMQVKDQVTGQSQIKIKQIKFRNAEGENWSSNQREAVQHLDEQSKRSKTSFDESMYLSKGKGNDQVNRNIDIILQNSDFDDVQESQSNEYQKQSQESPRPFTVMKGKRQKLPGVIVANYQLAKGDESSSDFQQAQIMNIQDQQQAYSMSPPRNRFDSSKLTKSLNGPSYSQISKLKNQARRFVPQLKQATLQNKMNQKEKGFARFDGERSQQLLPKIQAISSLDRLVNNSSESSMPPVEGSRQSSFERHVKQHMSGKAKPIKNHRQLNPLVTFQNDSFDQSSETKNLPIKSQKVTLDQDLSSQSMEGQVQTIELNRGSSNGKSKPVLDTMRVSPITTATRVNNDFSFHSNLQPVTKAYSKRRNQEEEQAQNDRVNINKATVGNDAQIMASEQIKQTKIQLGQIRAALQQELKSILLNIKSNNELGMVAPVADKDQRLKDALNGKQTVFDGFHLMQRNQQVFNSMDKLSGHFNNDLKPLINDSKNTTKTHMHKRISRTQSPHAEENEQPLVRGYTPISEMLGSFRDRLNNYATDHMRAQVPVYSSIWQSTNPDEVAQVVNQNNAIKRPKVDDGGRPRSGSKYNSRIISEQNTHRLQEKYSSENKNKVITKQQSKQELADDMMLAANQSDGLRATKTTILSNQKLSSTTKNIQAPSQKVINSFLGAEMDNHRPFGQSLVEQTPMFVQESNGYLQEQYNIISGQPTKEDSTRVKQIFSKSKTSNYPESGRRPEVEVPASSSLHDMQHHQNSSVSAEHLKLVESSEDANHQTIYQDIQELMTMSNQEADEELPIPPEPSRDDHLQSQEMTLRMNKPEASNELTLMNDQSSTGNNSPSKNQQDKYNSLMHDSIHQTTKIVNGGDLLTSSREPEVHTARNGQVVARTQETSAGSMKATLHVQQNIPLTISDMDVNQDPTASALQRGGGVPSILTDTPGGDVVTDRLTKTSAEQQVNALNFSRSQEHSSKFPSRFTNTPYGKYQHSNAETQQQSLVSIQGSEPNSLVIKEQLFKEQVPSSRQTAEGFQIQMSLQGNKLTLNSPKGKGGEDTKRGAESMNSLITFQNQRISKQNVKQSEENTARQSKQNDKQKSSRMNEKVVIPTIQTQQVYHNRKPQQIELSNRASSQFIRKSQNEMNQSPGLDQSGMDHFELPKAMITYQQSSNRVESGKDDDHSDPPITKFSTHKYKSNKQKEIEILRQQNISFGLEHFEDKRRSFFQQFSNLNKNEQIVRTSLDKGSKSIVHGRQFKISKLKPRFNKNLLRNSREQSPIQNAASSSKEVYSTHAQKGQQTNFDTLKTYQNSPFQSIPSNEMQISRDQSAIQLDVQHQPSAMEKTKKLYQQDISLSHIDAIATKTTNSRNFSAKYKFKSTPKHKNVVNQQQASQVFGAVLNKMAKIGGGFAYNMRSQESLKRLHKQIPTRKQALNETSADGMNSAHLIFDSQLQENANHAQNQKKLQSRNVIKEQQKHNQSLDTIQTVQKQSQNQDNLQNPRQVTPHQGVIVTPHISQTHFMDQKRWGHQGLPSQHSSQGNALKQYFQTPIVSTQNQKMAWLGPTMPEGSIQESNEFNPLGFLQSTDNLDEVLMELIGSELLDLSARLYGDQQGKQLAIAIMKSLLGILNDQKKEERNANGDVSKLVKQMTKQDSRMNIRQLLDAQGGLNMASTIDFQKNQLTSTHNLGSQLSKNTRSRTKRHQYSTNKIPTKLTSYNPLNQESSFPFNYSRSQERAGTSGVKGRFDPKDLLIGIRALRIPTQMPNSSHASAKMKSSTRRSAAVGDSTRIPAAGPPLDDPETSMRSQSQTMIIQEQE